MGLAVTIAIAGCGGGNQAAGQKNDRAAYETLLRGLRRAAVAGTAYKGAKRAATLERTDRAITRSFCELTWQMKVNREAGKLSNRSYVVGRVRSGAESSLIEFQPPQIQKAIDTLGSIIDLAGLDNDLVKRYSRACYA